MYLTFHVSTLILMGLGALVAGVLIGIPSAPKKPEDEFMW